MSLSNYYLCPRKQLDNRLSNEGKQLHFPAYGFLPVRTAPKNEQAANTSIASRGIYWAATAVTPGKRRKQSSWANGPTETESRLTEF